MSSELKPCPFDIPDDIATELTNIGWYSFGDAQWTELRKWCEEKSQQWNTRATAQHPAVEELALRKRQVGMLANCLSHIENSPIAPEGIKQAASLAIIGAGQIAGQIIALTSQTPAETSEKP